MTDIGRFQQTLSRFMTQDQSTGADVDIDDGEIGSGIGAGIGKGTRDDRPTTTAEDGDLARRFADALRRVGMDDGKADDLAAKAEIRSPSEAPDQRDPARDAADILIASSSAPTGYQSPYDFVTAAAASPVAPGQATSERIAHMVEKALKAEMSPIPGKPVEIALKLTDVVPGLDGLTVSMQAGAIDVVLQRSAAIDGLEALRASAAGLAESLRQRFGKRIVRIYERQSVGPQGETEADA